MIKKLLFLLLIVSTVVSFKSLNQDILELSVPYEFFYSNRQDWRSLEAKIQNSPQRVIILQWEGRGGHIDMGEQFIDFLKSSSKHIIIRVIGPSESMHALVVCNAPNIEFHRGWLMFHLMADSETNHVILTQESRSENQEFMSQCLIKGLVNQKDIDRVNQDQVLYVYPDGQKEFRRDTRSPE